MSAGVDFSTRQRRKVFKKESFRKDSTSLVLSFNNLTICTNALPCNSNMTRVPTTKFILLILFLFFQHTQSLIGPIQQQQFYLLFPISLCPTFFL